MWRPFTELEGRSVLRLRLICRKWNETVVSQLRILMGKNYFKNHEGVTHLSSDTIQLRESLQAMLFKVKLHTEEISQRFSYYPLYLTLVFVQPA